jgi:hypothetical protein
MNDPCQHSECRPVEAIQRIPGEGKFCRYHAHQLLAGADT